MIGGPQQIETANALLAKFGTLWRLYNAHVNEIEGVPGVGSQTAARLKAALAIGLRMATDDAQERTVITSPADAANLVMYDMGLLPEEHLRVILLNTRNHVIEIVEVYKGSVNSSQVRVGEVFQAAIAQKASAMIVCHNHPSSDISPSPDDVAVTRALPQPAVDGITCREVSDLARGVGFGCQVAVSTELQDRLDDQALYDLLWLAWHSLSLNGEAHVRFTLELEHQTFQLHAATLGQAVFVGRPEDF